MDYTTAQSALGHYSDQYPGKASACLNKTSSPHPMLRAMDDISRQTEMVSELARRLKEIADRTYGPVPEAQISSGDRTCASPPYGGMTGDLFLQIESLRHVTNELASVTLRLDV